MCRDRFCRSAWHKVKTGHTYSCFLAWLAPFGGPSEKKGNELPPGWPISVEAKISRAILDMESLHSDFHMFALQSSRNSNQIGPSGGHCKQTLLDDTRKLSASLLNTKKLRHNHLLPCHQFPNPVRKKVARTQEPPGSLNAE